MLEYLHVKNLALIKDIELKLSDNLNILSGETGAGKSVLLGSVSLALGSRADADLIRSGETYAYVELIFSVDAHIAGLLREMDIEPEDGQIIISRKIMDGKSQGKINGESVTNAVLRKVSALLLDIHGQHEHQSLLSEENHLKVLDAYGKDELSAALESYRNVYQNYKKIKEEIRRLGGDDEARKREIDFLAFELDEISEAGIRAGEEEELKKEHLLLSSGKVIAEGLSEVSSALSGTAADEVSEALRTAASLTAYDPSLQELVSELSELEALLTDAATDAKERLNRTDTDEKRLYDVESRLDVIGRLKRKYGGSEAEILKTYDELQHKYDELTAFDANKEEILEKMQEEKKKLIREAAKLHAVREHVAETFSQKMEESLKDLNFLAVRFTAEVNETNRYSADGADEVRFLISTNPGEELRALSKVASGGELSRIMLAIKALTAETDQIHTLIFDEIDTGISGRTALFVAAKMKEIAKNHQVICISHLPQIVGAADHHFLIEKHAEGQETVTSITELQEEDSVRELARLLAAGELTESSIENAREMKKILKQETKSA